MLGGGPRSWERASPMRRTSIPAGHGVTQGNLHEPADPVTHLGSIQTWGVVGPGEPTGLHGFGPTEDAWRRFLQLMLRVSNGKLGTRRRP